MSNVRLNVSASSFLLAAASAVLWLIGGNVLVALHYKRRGLPLESGFQPFAFPFRHFSAGEWAALGFLTVVCLALLVVALESSLG